MEQEQTQDDPDENSDDDPVVKEIPIIHSKRLEDNLYLFQYPLIRKNCTNEMEIRKCLHKPNNEQVELEMSMNIHSANFDTERAEFMAQQVDYLSGADGSEIYFKNEIVDKVVLTSSKAVSNPGKYAIAAFNGKEVHLTSLKGILQLRAAFPHLEKNLKRKKTAAESNGVSAADEEAAGPSTAKAVTVKFKKDDERWKKLRATSYKTLQAKRAEEKWVDCTWHENESSLSNIERLKLISENTEDNAQAQNLDDSGYLRLLIPEDQEQATVEPTLPSHVLSLHSLRILPLPEQCRLLLKDAQIIQFQQLVMLLTGGEGFTSELLLKTLPKVAVLVRGNWVVKSDVLYPANSFSATSGVPAEIMCRARDYVLYLFTKNQYVERKKVSSVMKIPNEEVKEIFTGISKLCHNKGWELKIGTDQDFVNKHGDLVHRQNAFWDQRYHQLCEFLKENKRQRRKSRSISDGDTKFRLSGSGPSNSFGSDNDSGTEKKSPIVSRKNKTVKVQSDNQETS